MSAELNEIIVQALEDVKGKNIVELDVRELSDVMDTLIIASGTSSRHVKSLAASVVEEAKRQGHPPLGVEGAGTDWVLVDFGDIVVHVMQEEARNFYDLEKLWAMEPNSRSAT